MALSNMRIEPRREWTEQAVGILAVLLFLCLDVPWAHWFATVTSNRKDDWWPTFTGALLLSPLVLIGVGLLFGGIWYLLHYIGEAVCEVLPFDPRPKQRYEEQRYNDYDPKTHSYKAGTRIVPRR